MAFVVTKREFATAPIKVFVYDEKGKQVEISFIAKYHRHTKTQVDELQDGSVNRYRKDLGQEPIKGRDGSIAEFPYDSDLDFIREKMCGWLQVRDAAGQAQEFSLEALGAVVEDFPELVPPLFNGFFEAHRGSRQKNS